MRNLIDLIEAASPAVYYHATFTTRTPGIEVHGLKTGRRSNRQSAVDEGAVDPAVIYLFEDATSAVRWAASMEAEYGKPTSIVVVNNPPGLLSRDADQQMQLSGYHAVTTDEPIPASHIGRIVPLSSELRQSVLQGGSAQLVESLLLEKLFYRVELKNHTVSVLENPFRRELIGSARNDWWRGFLTDDGKVYMWDAFYATHADIGRALGIRGKTFELRSDKSMGPMSRLFLTRIEAQTPERAETWKTNRRIQRLFDGEVSIGSLRW